MAQDKISKATAAETAKDNAELKATNDIFKISPSGLRYSITDYDGKENNKGQLI